MKTTKGLILTLLWYFNLCLAKPQHKESLNNFWENAKPGELLRSLDAITANTQHLTQPLQLEANLEENLPLKELSENARLQRRIDEESEESLEEQTPHDYDKVYEEFVKKYFDDSLTEALSDDSGSAEDSDAQTNDAEAYSGEEDSSEADDAITEASKKSPKTLEKCKKILRGEQNCLICKNSRNGETSEECSYNKHTTPLSYAFENKRNYRKYRGNPNISDEEDYPEDAAPADASLKKPPARGVPNNKTNDTTTCIMNKIKNRLCYYCENQKGEKITNCYADELPMNTSNDDTKDNKKKIQKSHQRIYKRTITYSYENKPHTNEKRNNTNVSDQTPLIQQEHVLLKQVNENER